MTTAAVFVGVLFLAGFIEFAVERLFGSFLAGKWMVYIATAAGVVVAIVFKVGLLQSLGISGIDMTTTVAEWADYAITGILIGAGSTKVHEFFDKYLTKEG